MQDNKETKFKELQQRLYEVMCVDPYHIATSSFKDRNLQEAIRVDLYSGKMDEYIDYLDMVIDENIDELGDLAVRADTLKSELENFDKTRKIENEMGFLKSKEDGYAVYRLNRHIDPNIMRLMGEFERVQWNGIEDKTGYKMLQSGKFNNKLSVEGYVEELLDINKQEYLLQRVLLCDVIAIKKDNIITTHFVNVIGTKEINGFFNLAELELEENYNQIDGVINNCTSPKSVLKELRNKECKELREELKIYNNKDLKNRGESRC